MQLLLAMTSDMANLTRMSDLVCKLDFHKAARMACSAVRFGRVKAAGWPTGGLAKPSHGTLKVGTSGPAAR
jgi:hypothetical protein